MELDLFAKKLAALLPELIRSFMRRQSTALSRGQITVPQMAILQLLRQKKICTMGEIAGHLSITMAAATGLVGRLVRAKLVERSGYEADRRIVNVSLTDKGRRLVEDARRQMEKVIEDVFGKLTEEERRSHLKIVEKLLSAMRKGVAVLLVLLFIGRPAFAQEEAQVFDIPKSVETALANNYTIAQAKEKIEQSRAKVNQAFSAFLPVLGTDNSYTRFDRASTFSLSTSALSTKIKEKKTYAMNLNVTQPIFTGGRILSSYLQAREVFNASMQDALRTKQTLIYEVKDAYFAILTARKLNKVNEEALAKLQSHLTDVQNLFEVGVVAKVDLLRTQVELAHVRQVLIASNNASALAEAAFCNLLNLPLDKNIDVADVLDYVHREANLNECSQAALAARPDVLSAQKNVKAARHGVWVARSELFPQVNLTASRDRTKGQTQPLDRWYYSSQALVSADMTLWDWGNTYNKIKEEKSKAKEALAALELLKDNVLLEVKQACLNLEEAYQKVEEAKSAIALAQESYRVTDERYKGGVSTNTDVLDARAALTQAEHDYYGALYGYQLAWAALEYAVGGEIK